MKSRQKNWRESRSRETEDGEKIAVTTTNPPRLFVDREYTYVRVTK